MEKSKIDNLFFHSGVFILITIFSSYFINHWNLFNEIEKILLNFLVLVVLFGINFSLYRENKTNTLVFKSVNVAISFLFGSFLWLIIAKYNQPILYEEKTRLIFLLLWFSFSSLINYLFFNRILLILNIFLFNAFLYQCFIYFEGNDKELAIASINFLLLFFSFFFYKKQKWFSFALFILNLAIILNLLFCVLFNYSTLNSYSLLALFSFINVLFYSRKSNINYLNYIVYAWSIALIFSFNMVLNKVIENNIILISLLDIVFSILFIVFLKRTKENNEGDNSLSIIKINKNTVKNKIEKIDMFHYLLFFCGIINGIVFSLLYFYFISDYAFIFAYIFLSYLIFETFFKWKNKENIIFKYINVLISVWLICVLFSFDDNYSIYGVSKLLTDKNWIYSIELVISFIFIVLFLFKFRREEDIKTKSYYLFVVIFSNLIIGYSIFEKLNYLPFYEQIIKSLSIFSIIVLSYLLNKDKYKIMVNKNIIINNVIFINLLLSMFFYINATIDFNFQNDVITLQSNLDFENNYYLALFFIGFNLLLMQQSLRNKIIYNASLLLIFGLIFNLKQGNETIYSSNYDIFPFFILTIIIFYLEKLSMVYQEEKYLLYRIFSKSLFIIYFFVLYSNVKNVNYFALIVSLSMIFFFKKEISSSIIKITKKS